MTREEAIKNLQEIIEEGWLISDFDKCTAIDACEMAIKALEQEPCEDCISRQDTLAEFKRVYFDNDTVIRCAELVLGGMPSITPQTKKGHWIRVDKDKLRCSECEVIHFIAQYPQSAKINFCPNCGRKMMQEVEER